jgi:hypothetical protein
LRREGPCNHRRDLSPLVELLEENLSKFAEDQVKIVPEPLDDIDVQTKGWNQAFDLVFVSMCPVIHNWDSVEKILQCAQKFCYISMPASPPEHSLVNEIWPLITGQPFHTKHMEMGYLLHLLYLKGYAYESLITREMKTTEVSKEAALQEALTWLRNHRLPVDERNRSIIADYLEQAYPSGKVVIHEGGRFWQSTDSIAGSEHVYERDLILLRRGTYSFQKKMEKGDLMALPIINSPLPTLSMSA